jgi:hypothetical protein
MTGIVQMALEDQETISFHSGNKKGVRRMQGGSMANGCGHASHREQREHQKKIP